MNTRLQYTLVKPSPALGHKYIPNNKGSSPEQAVANQRAIGSTETWCQWQQQGQRTSPRLIFCCFCLLEYFILKRRRHPYKPLYDCILLPHCLPPHTPLPPLCVIYTWALLIVTPFSLLSVCVWYLWGAWSGPCCSSGLLSSWGPSTSNPLGTKRRPTPHWWTS